MELLGLIDALEATILSSPKLLLTNKTIIDEPKVISIIDKIRLVIKNGGHIIHDSVAPTAREEMKTQSLLERKITPETPVLTATTTTTTTTTNKLDQVDDIIERAKREAKDVVENADAYAVDILEKLHLTVLKMQRNISRMEQTIVDSKSNLQNDTLKETIEKI